MLYLIPSTKYFRCLLQTFFSSKEIIMTGHVTDNLYIISRKTDRSERLKNRLKLHFENNIVFHKQPDPSNPEIVYSSTISLQDVINNASSMSVESSRAEVDFKAAETDSGHEQTVTLYHASQIIKSSRIVTV